MSCRILPNIWLFAKPILLIALSFEAFARAPSPVLMPSSPLFQDSKIVVTGTVTDINNTTLPGVNVVLKSTPQVGTSTDVDGKFSISVSPSDVLVFSYIGFEKEEVAVGNQTVLNIILTPDIQSLQEVVVVGYGEQKRVTVTGSVSTVNMADMQSPVRSLSNALAGKVAGVISMQSGGGEPGYDNPTFTIRGIGTFTGSVSPLIIVDGVQRDDVNSTYGGAFNNIDPEDIASISLLKDASATAVYGAKGANGVLIITTKRGMLGPPKISVKIESGVTGLTKLPKMLDGVNYMRLLNEANVNDGNSPTYSDEIIAKTASGLDPYLYPNVNWTETIYKDWASMTNANINVSGGGETMRYYVSMSFYNQDGQYKVSKLNGYDPNLNFKRYDFRSNIDIDVTKTTVLSLNLAAMLVNSRYPGNSAGNIWYAAYATNPISFPVQYPGGRWAGPRNNGGTNPFNLVQNSGYTTEFKPSLQSILTLNQRLDAVTDGLSATLRFSFDSYGVFNTERRGTNDLWYAASRNPDDGSLVYERTRTGSTYLGYGTSSSGERVMYLETNLAYNRAFGKHNLGGLLVYNMRNRVTGTAANLKFAIPYRSQNIAGRITYSYADKYLAEVNVGATGSENFAKGQRWGYFPAAAVGWVLSNEDFFQPFTQTFNLVKIRASRGVTGNDLIGNGSDRFGYLTYVDGAAGASFGPGNLSYGGIAESVLGTDNLTWEKSTKDDLGLEIGLFDKVNIVVDAFRDKRKDILINRSSISSIAGYSSLAIYANMGEMVNEGFDGSIEYNEKIGQHISLRLFGNFTYARNEILFADNPKSINSYQQYEGTRFGEFTGHVDQGLFIDQSDVDGSPTQTRSVYPGDIKYADLNTDGTINGNDWKYLGISSFPTKAYGFGFAVGYKNFEFSTLFQGVADVGIMANGSATTGDGASGVGVVPFAGIGQYTANVLDNIRSRWTAENPSQNVDYPRLTITNTSDNNYVNSTWWLKNGNYCRLRQAMVGYRLTTEGLSKLGIDNMQFYVSGTNLLTFSKFKLWDPELGSNGAKYPYARTITLGVRAQF
jgi:TonB-linked SusC/RagA family outer membrane protein